MRLGTSPSVAIVRGQACGDSGRARVPASSSRELYVNGILTGKPEGASVHMQPITVVRSP